MKLFRNRWWVVFDSAIGLMVSGGPINIGAELNIAATNIIPPLNPSRKGSEPSQIRDMFSTP